jgi:pimeloyl-ACP methyl ester carboxylesterase
MARFEHDGIVFHYLDVGRGVPFVFQHGIGGDVRQPVNLLVPPQGIRLLCLDARAHGQTQPLGDPADLTFEVFGDDLVAFLDHLGVERAVLGGISMGAGVALNVAVRYPERVAGLVLSRPAWLDGPMPPRNVARYANLARLLRAVGAAGDTRHALGCAVAEFEASDDYRNLLASSPDTARSLRGQLTNERAVAAVARLERLPADRPLADLWSAETIRVPTLVLAHQHDPIHLFAFGEVLANRIPGARLAELTPKSIAPERHAPEVQGCLEAFLRRFTAPCGRKPRVLPPPLPLSPRVGVRETQKTPSPSVGEGAQNNNELFLEKP